MANIKSQIKRNRQNDRRHQANRALRSELRTRVRSAVAAAEADADADDTALQVRAAVKSIDTAAAKGAIHKHQAARRKSRLMAKVNARATASG